MEISEANTFADMHLFLYFFFLLWSLIFSQSNRAIIWYKYDDPRNNVIFGIYNIE